MNAPGLNSNLEYLNILISLFQHSSESEFKQQLSDKISEGIRFLLQHLNLDHRIEKRLHDTIRNWINVKSDSSPAFQFLNSRVRAASQILQSSRKAILIYGNDDKYVGDFLNGKRTGRGTLTYANGSIYVGDFFDDQPHGQGTYTLPTGESYSGTFVHGIQYGTATYYWPSGSRCEGIFYDGKLIRGGTWFCPLGMQYKKESGG